MFVDVVAVKPVRAMRLRVRIKNGAKGEVDLARWLPKVGVFRRLNDPAFFRRVRVNSETGTIEWPNQADVDPLVLYHWVTGRALPRWAGPLDDGCPSCTKRLARASLRANSSPARRSRAAARAGARRRRQRRSRRVSARSRARGPA